MQVIRNEHTVFIDIDNTLVMHNKQHKDLIVTCPYTLVEEHLTIHHDHVKQLVRNKARGNTIVVWSHAGFQWAEAVICALNLQDHVDFIMSKPIKIIDDEEPNNFLSRVYLPFKE